MSTPGGFKRPYVCTACLGDGDVEVVDYQQEPHMVPCIQCLGNGIIWSATDPWETATD